MALWSNIVSQFDGNSDTLCKFGKCHSPRNTSVLIFSCYDDLNALEENISAIFSLDVRNDFSVLELASSPLQRVTNLSHKCVRWVEKVNLWSGEGCSVKGASDGMLVSCGYYASGSLLFFIFFSLQPRFGFLIKAYPSI